MAAVSCGEDIRDLYENLPGNNLSPDEREQMEYEQIGHMRNEVYLKINSRICGYSAFNGAESEGDIRSDFFHATVLMKGFGFGDMYEWNYTDYSTPSQMWSDNRNISNFMEQVLGKYIVFFMRYSKDKYEDVSEWMGEAYFLKAYFQFDLLCNFSKDYVGNEASQAVPYGNTLEEAYAAVLADLDKAASLIRERGKEGSGVVTLDVVDGMRARVMMKMGDYEAVTGLIDDEMLSRYPLCASEEAFCNMWAAWLGDECLWALPAEEKYESIWYDLYGYLQAEMFIPEKWVVDIFGEYPEDFRTKNHLQPVDKDGKIVFALSKFPEGHNFKPMRVAEMYLLLAEAYYRTGNYSKASDYLSRLRSARIPGYSAKKFTGDELYKEIRDERVRELIGEGFRMNDLQRYFRDGGMDGMRRGEAQAEELIFMPEVHQNFHIAPDDHRIILPIPSTALKEFWKNGLVQNPGY